MPSQSHLTHRLLELITLRLECVTRRSKGIALRQHVGIVSSYLDRPAREGGGEGEGGAVRVRHYIPTHSAHSASATRFSMSSSLLSEAFSSAAMSSFWRASLS